MIGFACVAKFPYYDIKTHSNKHKARPVLIIGQSDCSDYVCLPISRVTKSEYIHTTYDIQITPEKTPLLSLKQTSYIRTHKQAIINSANLTKKIINFQSEYPDIYCEVLNKVELFQNSIFMPHY